jgi:hypothetical protein
MECFLVEEKKIWLDLNEVWREEKEKRKKEIFTMISEKSKDVVMTGHDCCGEDIGCNYVSFDYMKKLSKKQMKKFPMLVVESIVCKSYHISRFEKCSGCDNAISGCEKIFDAGCN